MKVAVYSGTIPSTTFVEHLINGLGENGVEVLLFGKFTKKYNPSKPNIKVYASPTHKIQMILFVIRELVKLLFKDYRTFTKLPHIVNGRDKSIPEAIMYLSRILPIINQRPEIFHIQWVKAVEEFFWIKDILNIPIIISLRGGQLNYSPVADKELAETFRKYFPKIDHFHGVSEAIIKEAIQYELDPAKATVIRPAVQKSLLEIPLKKTQKKASLSILSVGRFHWKKGYHFALDAMKTLKSKNINFHYTIVAAGDHEEIIFQIYSLGLEDQVSVVYGLPHKEVIEKMANADLFLLPSVEEGIANVVLEAMAAGTPVITSNCGGMEEVVIDQVNGFLVPVRDPDAIVAAIELFCKLPDEKLYQIRENARKTIIANHLVDNQVTAFKALYQKVYHNQN